MTNKVFIVLVHRDTEDYLGASEIYAACSTLDKAKEQMEKCYNDEHEYMLCDLEEEDIEIRKEDMLRSLFNTLNNIDFVKITIVEKEVL